MRLRRGRFARGGRFVFRPRLGGRLELSGVFGGSPSFASSAATRSNSARISASFSAGLARKLAQGDKALVANKGFRRFLKTPASDGFVIDRAKIAADARFDGLFVLRTNTKIVPPSGRPALSQPAGGG
jgi:hypothetical protein